jgi:cell wall assembly regulator SMI1
MKAAIATRARAFGPGAGAGYHVGRMSALTVSGVWRRIEDALGARAGKALRPAATARARAALERALGRRLPRDLAASLSQHDGGAAGPPLWLNEQLLGAAAAARRARMMNALVREGHAGADHWKRAWIPLTDADGDGFCLDAIDGRVIRFRNFGDGRPRVAAATFVTWLASIPGRIRAEARAERETNALLAPPAPAAAKRERDRLARMDEELPFLVFFVEDLRTSRLPSTRARVLQFRPVRRFPAAEVLQRGLERGFLVERGQRISVTPLGRRLRRAALG